jgi:imidazolonepropionase-like amidohydrolase
MSVSTLIKNAHIHPVTSKDFVGDLLIEGDKILDCSHKIFAHADQVVDATGLHCYPGMIEEHCHIGIHGEKTNQGSDNDTNEWSEPVTAQVRALDGIKPFDPGFREAVGAGVTTVNVYPGSANPMGGIGITLKNDLTVPYEERIILEESGFKMAMGENPKRVHSQSKSIMTRMATAEKIRSAFRGALDYQVKKEKEPDKTPYDMKNEAILKVLNGELNAHVHAHQADDIMTVLRIFDEFGIKPMFEHTTEGHLVADELAEREITVAVGPMFTARYKMEVNNRTMKTPGILEKAGVKNISIITDHPVIPIYDLPIQATMAIKNGLSREEALRAITINPAINLGIADRVGSLEVGKDADFILTDRELLDPTHRVLYTYINGKLAYNMNEEGLTI